jgi:predicted nucleic acid-binding protein
MTSVFLDADVIMDFYVQREPHHQLALRLFSHLKRAKTRCYTSAVIISNIYYLLARIENSRYALEKIRSLRKFVSIAPIDEATIDAALSSPYKDFEDSIQLHCAMRNGIKVLITRNVRDYPKAHLLVVDPGQYLSATVEKRD